MTVLLLANAAATLFLVGVTWFVQVVHYPLFPAVGSGAFEGYHVEHSRRTTLVVVGPMVVELVSSLALVADPPDDRTALAAAGAVLAVAAWVLTFAAAVPAHRRLGEGPDDDAHRSLMTANLVRTVVWSAHGAVVIALLATAL